jgi:tetratricopeptide (TPR) repeat protein
MVRQGLAEQAAEIAANYLAILNGKGVADGLASLVEPLFDDNAESALVWFNYLHQREKEPTTAAAMKTVRALFAGKPVAGRNAWAKDLLGTATERQPPKPAGAADQPAQPAALGGQDRVRMQPAHHVTLPDRVAAGLAAGTVMLAAGNDKLAEDFFVKAAGAANTTAAAIVQCGDFFAEKKRFKDAAIYYSRAAELDSGNALALFLQGWALTQAGNTNEGKRLTELAHWLPLGSEGLRGDFAQELEKRGFVEDARRERDLVLTVGWYRYWHVGNVINNASRMAIQKKDFAKAVALLEKGIIGSMRMGASFVEPQAYLVIPASVSHHRARQLLNEGKTDDALALIRGVLDALPGQIEIVIETVPALEKAGRKKDVDELFTRTTAAYEAMCKEYPQSAFAHNSFAWLCANCRRRLDDALTHAQTAVKLEPKAAGYLDTLAEVHFRRGEREKAIEMMQKCVAMEPKSSYFRKQLERFRKGDVSSEVPDHDE